MSMKPLNRRIGLLLGIFLLAAGVCAAQENAQAQYSRRFYNGVKFYKEALWLEAAAEFRGAQETAANTSDWAQALYWVILTELAYADYGSAVRDMDELEKNAPKSSFTRDMSYHRARAYFNQGYFEDALVLFKRYNDSVSVDDTEAADRKAAAYFWMGECLYSMGQFDEAERFYSWVLARYPESPKIDISSYRVDLIKQKKIEAELLALLRWSHEESLRTSEDYQQKIRTYEYTLNFYQRRIAELQGSTVQTPDRRNPPASETENLRTPDNSSTVQPGQTEVERAAIPQNELNGNISDPSDELIERAKLLGYDLQKIIREHESSGGQR